MSVDFSCKAMESPSRNRHWRGLGNAIEFDVRVVAGTLERANGRRPFGLALFVFGRVLGGFDGGLLALLLRQRGGIFEFLLLAGGRGGVFGLLFVFHGDSPEG